MNLNQSPESLANFVLEANTANPKLLTIATTKNAYDLLRDDIYRLIDEAHRKTDLLESLSLTLTTVTTQELSNKFTLGAK